MGESVSRLGGDVDAVLLAVWGSFTLQIYFDFSGYSDMQVGLGKLLDFTYPKNFHYPYTSRGAMK